MSEFLASLSQGRTTSGQALGPGEVRIVWPTVEDVRQSIEGYCAGGAIPGPEKNVTRPWLQQYWSKFEVRFWGDCYPLNFVVRRKGLSHESRV